MKIIIIGAGPGGYETAVLAAKRGVETVLIEAGPVGGTCLNEGCIPTKSFCKNAEFVDQLQESEIYGVGKLDFKLDFTRIAERKNAVVEQLRSGVESLLKNKLITLVRGRAFFKDEHTVSVIPNEDASMTQDYTADYIIVATGSVSANLPIPGADLPGILTSKELLDIDHIPDRLCVIGGGVIGLEFASIFRSFGSEVTVIEYCKDILPRFDTDLAKRLKQSLTKRGIEINTQSQVLSISQKDMEYEVSFSRKGKEEKVHADKVLMAVGRRAALGSLNFSDIGVETSSKGVVVNEFMQTNIPHIYAVGDINGKMMLAHAATFQGIVALDHIMGIENGIDLSVMPAAVFTSPEAASVGMTEEDCKEAGIPIKALKSFFRANGKAVTMGETDGFCKVIVAAEPKEGAESPYEPGRILGCHLYGPHASDIVQEACALITRKSTLKEFEDIIHTHPTLTEVLQSAVHN
jgi:dihydrolipoamide dehydrogenase